MSAYVNVFVLVLFRLVGNTGEGKHIWNVLISVLFFVCKKDALLERRLERTCIGFVACLWDILYTSIQMKCQGGVIFVLAPRLFYCPKRRIGYACCSLTGNKTTVTNHIGF